MREALDFYADPTRYHGPNQRNDHADKWSGESPYIRDVTRDGGAIARAALAEQPAPSVPDDVAKDAARYRWLREKDNASSIVHGYLHKGTSWLPRRSKLDAIIDAAMPEPPQ